MKDRRGTELLCHDSGAYRLTMPPLLGTVFRCVVRLLHAIVHPDIPTERPVEPAPAWVSGRMVVCVQTWQWLMLV